MVRECTCDGVAVGAAMGVAIAAGVCVVGTGAGGPAGDETGSAAANGFSIFSSFARAFCTLLSLPLPQPALSMALQAAASAVRRAQTCHQQTLIDYELIAKTLASAAKYASGTHW